MDEDHFDIIAKAPAEIAIEDTDNPTSRSNPLNLDAIRPMLQALLISRFRIEFHMEDRRLNANWLALGYRYFGYRYLGDRDLETVDSAIFAPQLVQLCRPFSSYLVVGRAP